MSFVAFETNIFGGKTLPLPLLLSKIIMNRQYLSLTGFESIEYV